MHRQLRRRARAALVATALGTGVGSAGVAATGSAAGTDNLPAYVSAAPIDPRDVDVDSTREWSECHGERPGQLDFRPAPEARAIAATGRARRDGLDLIVGKARFRDAPFEKAEADGVEFVYVGRFRAVPVDVVHVQYYEGDGWILVDRQSGAHVELGGPPRLSPDRQAFAAQMTSEETDTGVNIVRRTPKGFGAVETVPTNQPCDLAWAGVDRLTMKIRQDDGLRPSSNWAPAVLRRIGARWGVE